MNAAARGFKDGRTPAEAANYLAEVAADLVANIRCANFVLGRKLDS